jgi:hypothetical protein
LKHGLQKTPTFCLSLGVVERFCDALSVSPNGPPARAKHVHGFWVQIFSPRSLFATQLPMNQYQT